MKQCYQQNAILASKVYEKKWTSVYVVVFNWGQDVSLRQNISFSHTSSLTLWSTDVSELEHLQVYLIEGNKDSSFQGIWQPNASSYHNCGNCYVFL